MKDSELRQVLDEIRATLGALAGRVAAIEEKAVTHTPPVVAAAPAPVPAPKPAGLTEDMVMAITAAVAAFLGERAHVRQIRLISSSAWAQQGRVSVQASHRLAR
jgi:methylmalonyl-CoA carboxyltransferase large subunit